MSPLNRLILTLPAVILAGATAAGAQTATTASSMRVYSTIYSVGNWIRVSAP